MALVRAHNQAGITGAARGWVAAACAAALGLGGLGATAAPAAASDPDSVTLEKHSASADLIGAVGTSLVAASDEGGVWLRTSGGQWQETGLSRHLRAGDVTSVGPDALVTVDGATVQLLDTSDATVTSVDIGDQLWTATASTAVRLEGWERGLGQASAVDLQTMASTSLTWPLSDPPSTASIDRSGLGRGWINDRAWIAPAMYRNAAGTLVATDLSVMPLDGAPTAFTVRVSGKVLFASGPVSDGGPIRYVSLRSGVLRDCSVAADLRATCRTIRTGVSGTPSVHAFANTLGITVGSTSFTWTGGRRTTVTGVPAGTTARFTADGTTAVPVLTARGSKGGFYSVTKGRALRTAPAIVEPVAVRSMALGAGWLVGTDNAGSLRGWLRPLGGGLGQQQVVGTPVRQVMTSGDRVVVNGAGGLWWYRGATRTAKLGAAVALQSLSGPYALVRTKGGTSILRTEARVIASGIVGAIGQFGTHIAQVDQVAHTVTVRDWASGAGVPVGNAQGYEADDLGDLVGGGLWGDLVMLAFERSEADGSVTPTTLVWNYVDDAPYLRHMFRPALGDGVVVGTDVDGKRLVWNLGNGGPTYLPDVVGDPVVSASGAVAYTDTGGKLWVTSLNGAAGGASAPRALGLTAGGTDGKGFFIAYDGWRVPWRLTAEATKATGAGTLTIRDGDEVVATRAVTASATGTISVDWDGLDDRTGEPADTRDADTWVLDVPAADGTGALRSIDGTPLTGTIRVSNDFMDYPVTSLKINDTSPVVGQTLTATTAPVAPAANFSYRWYRGTTLVGTESTYTVSPSDLGARLRVSVFASGAGPYLYNEPADPFASGPTSKVGKGTIPGEVQLQFTPSALVQGRPVTVAATGWVPDAVVATYAWYRRGSGSTRTKVASGATYTPTAADVGRSLEVVVTLRAPGYADRKVSFPAPAAVQASP